MVAVDVLPSGPCACAGKACPVLEFLLVQYRSHASVHDFGVICLPAGRRAPASEWYKTGLCLDILSSSDDDVIVDSKGTCDDFIFQGK
ncbi:Os06g0192701 [Oryza sativa Japonica Group]|uniref:Os06g0192701 protein n=1 Tax=Oryza sativa subsp. japonica TaxID=39947 RepID=C7J3M0_ORYSJ|nr:Os06g0192701 [Oryza sativa Japonica Group]|eukprot:NP_001174649.1 Os06g0192701 [Oryza sativa Japonica Group]